MAQVPTEVWLKVFYFACTDTGKTGRALSLVSKAFNEGSKMCQFRSIAIAGLDQLLRFVAKLASMDLAFRSTEYLFVSSTRMPRAEESNPSAEEVRRHEALLRHRLLRWTQPSDEEAMWQAKLLELLQMVSHTLHTLTIHGNIPRMCTLLPVNLPNLIELTVHTPIMALLPNDDSILPLPQLRYLKLAIYPIQPIMILRRIRELAPNLEYLLLTVVEKPEELNHPLQEALWMPDDEGHLWSIRQIHIQPSQRPNALRGTSSQGRLPRDILALARRDRRLTVHGMGFPWSIVHAQQDWLMSTNGGWMSLVFWRTFISTEDRLS